MPRNGSGTYSVPPGSTAVPNTTISSSTFNALIADLAQDANTDRPVVAGGTGASTGDDAAKNLGLVSAKDLAGTGTVGGTANAITLTTARVYTALSDTVYLSFKATADIAAGGTTLNLDGLGAKKIRKVAASGDVDVNVGDIIEDGIYTLRYDTTANSAAGAFILLNGSGSDAYSVGDFLNSARTLSSDWLRRDGALYDSVDYPELAAILPALADSVDWELEAANTTVEAFSIVQAEGRITALYANGSNANVTASVGGGAWNVRATITGFSNPVAAYGVGTFVAVDGNGKCSTSPDGDTWSSPAAIDTGTIGCTGITFGAGLFVAVGLRDGGGGGIWTSPDGATWTERTSGSAQILNGVDFVNSVFIATGNNGVILTSTDGITWTSRTSGVTAVLYAAAYLGGTYAVCGASGTILTSTNLSGWTSRTSGVSTTLRSIIANTLGFLVVGASGVARISDDAISWTGTTTGITATIYDVIYDSSDDALYYASANLTSILYGVRTLPTQFRVPSDDPTYGWIKAVS